MHTWESMRAIVKGRTREQGIQQRFLAAQCGFDEKTFSLIINGRKPVTDTIIIKFCKGMNVTPNDIIVYDTAS